jgi:hypothetical protein
VLSLIVTGLVTAALPARAWHDEGHRIVARVAERFLTDKTRAELRRILGTEEVGRGLAVAATYMDDHKPMLANQIQGSANWHFDSMPVCPVSQPANYCANGVCASAQINAHIAMLADPVNHDGIKLQTVRYLTHLIGDIQQPLHASGNDDRGGNDIKLTPVFESYGFYDNLHSLWDGYWVKKALRTSKLKEADYADALVTRYQDKASEWAQGDVQAWIKESNTVSREVVYGRLPGWACGKKTEGPLTLERDYLMVGDELVPERLFKGGVRLAKVLNTALGK